MAEVYVAGVGMTKFGRSSEALTELFCTAAERALESSPVEVEAIYIGVMNPEEFTGESNIASQITDALGMTGVPALRVETASSAGAAAVLAAFHAVASGYYRNVLVLGGEKMTHLSTSATTRILAEVIDREERRSGATMPALAAMIAETYRKRYRLSRSRFERILCAVAMKNHRNGAANPHAQFQSPITEKAYFSSKLVATPLRLYDCSPITDGAAAVVLTAQRTDVLISGIGHGTGPLSLRERDTFTSFRATEIAAARAYRIAGISPREIDFAEVHDAFTPFEIITTEDLGLFPAGKGWRAVEDGTTAVEGALPINPSGGLKSRGHPVGASGVAQVVEAVWRLRGMSEPKLKREARRALTQSTGGLGTNNFVTILERADRPRRGPNAAPVPAPAVRHAPQSKSKKDTTPPEPSDEGKIETFTILYVTPDGFLPPLALALVRDQRGALLMAQGEDISHLKIGREVFLRRLEGVYYFTVKSHLKKVREGLRRLLRRLPSLARTGRHGQGRKKAV
ncbi:MAG: thiolase family protein [Deltaproteobacteria bacterium]|nr:thiolase family protein [Deltaproteobacteria bacterium]